MVKPPLSEQLMTLTEAARKFDLRDRTLRAAATTGRLRAQKSGHIWLVSAAAVGEWVAHQSHIGGRPRQDKSEDGASE